MVSRVVVIKMKMTITHNKQEINNTISYIPTMKLVLLTDHFNVLQPFCDIIKGLLICNIIYQNDSLREREREREERVTIIIECNSNLYYSDNNVSEYTYMFGCDMC